MSLPTCPKCGSQLEVKLTFASGPRSSEQKPEGDLSELLDQIADEDLSGAALKFVTETRERFAQYGSRTRMSEKQMAWLQRIAGGETGNDW